jgi:hypothetical protein
MEFFLTIGWMDWINLDQDRKQYRAVVTTVMNIRVLQVFQNIVE